VKSTITLADGSTVTNPPGTQCWVEYTIATMTTECEAPKTGRYGSVSKFMLLAPGKYRTEMTENARSPQMVGSRASAEFRFEGDRLLLTAYPPAFKGNPPKAPVKAVGEWERVQ
jgi:hypothetical protein